MKLPRAIWERFQRSAGQNFGVVVRSYIENFSLISYFDEDAPPSHGPWGRWLSGKDPALGADLSRVLWFTFSGARTTFADASACSGCPITTGLDFKRRVFHYLQLVERELDLTLQLNGMRNNPLFIDGDLPGYVLNDYEKVMIVYAYSIWLVDQTISAVISGDPRNAALAGNYASSASSIAQDYFESSPDLKSRFEHMRQSRKAQMRHMDSAASKEKLAIKNLWMNGREQIEGVRGGLKAFVFEMLGRGNGIKNDETIRRWIREWKAAEAELAGDVADHEDDETEGV